MQNVPKIVKERLKSAAIAVDHPDANVLSAFSERTLADRERSQVMEHLARCGECREVVALAFLPEEPGLAVVRPPRGSWLSWPRLRWGLVAAGVIVVGSFGLLRYEHARDLTPVALQSQRRDVLLDEAKNLPAPSREAPAENSLSTTAAKSPDMAGKSQIAETKKESDAVNLVARSEAPRDDKTAMGNRATILRGQQLSHGPMPPAQWQQNLNANTANQQMMFQRQVPAPAPRTPVANEQFAAGVTVSAQSSPATAPTVGGPVPSEKKAQDLDTLALQGQSVSPLSSTRGNSGAEVARAKDAEPPANPPKAQAVGAYAVAESSTSNFSPSGSLVPESARWAINSAGGLQRSFDQGRNWQSIDVNSGARDSAGLDLQLAMKSSHAKAATKDKADAMAKPIIFRAVAANGPDVWAGGSEATLFHSTDSGDHWIRIQPSWRGVLLSGDILSLQFADPQHGRIVTSTAEIWTTADAGQTWDKQ
jgi:hypothetical protein